MANWFDLTGTMIITSFLYMLGPRGLYVEFRGGAVLVLAFLIAYTGKWHRRSGVMTAAEWMTYRFGTGRASEAARLLTAIRGVAIAVMMLAYLIRGASLFLGMFFPFPPMVTTLVLLLITTAYTVSAGFYGVVLTDLVQGVIVLISCVIVSFMAWHYVPDMHSLAATAQSVTGNAHWTDAHLPVNTTMPPGYEQYQPLLLLASFYLFRNVLDGLGTGAEQRYFAARSDRDCGLQSMLQGLMVAFRWPLMIGFAVMGIYLVRAQYPDPAAVQKAAALVHQYSPATTEAYWSDLTSGIVNAPAKYPAELTGGLRDALGDQWAGKLPLVGFRGAVNPEQILPAVLINSIPTGLKGLIVVAMFAAMMSCKNGWVNQASAFCVKDIYQNFLRPRASNRELILASYLSTLGVVVLGYVFGVASDSINDIWGWILMSFTAGGLAPAMLRLYWWRCTAWGLFGGLLLGGLGAIAQRIWFPHLPEIQQFCFVTVLSFGGTIISSLLTSPTPFPVLQHFYRTTRPFGLWKPLRGEFVGAERVAIDLENRNDMTTVPFALLWQVTMFLLPMELVIKAYGAFWMTMPLFLVGVAGLYKYWWLNLAPPSSEPATPNPITQEISHVL